MIAFAKYLGTVELDDSQRQMILDHLGIVEHALHTPFIQQAIQKKLISKDDARSVANEAIAKAALGYNEAKGKFEKYCFLCIFKMIEGYINKEKRRGVTVGRGRLPVKLHIRFDTAYPVVEQETEVARPDIALLVKKLSRSDQKLVKQYYWEGKTLKQIAADTGSSDYTLCRRLDAIRTQLRLDILAAEER